MTDDVLSAWSTGLKARLTAQLTILQDAIRESDRVADSKLTELEQSFDRLEDIQHEAEDIQREAEAFLRAAKDFLHHNRPYVGSTVN
jgi:ABC-type transporter Mla subunit MlaD